MRLRTSLLLVASAACDGASPPPRVVVVEPAPAAASPSAFPASSTPSPSSPAPASTDACVEDAQAKSACAARGAGFQYGPRPYVYCSGVAPRPGQEQAEHDAIRRSPCECVDQAALAQRRHECSRVPSAPPPRGR